MRVGKGKGRYSRSNLQERKCDICNARFVPIGTSFSTAIEAHNTREARIIEGWAREYGGELEIGNDKSCGWMLRCPHCWQQTKHMPDVSVLAPSDRQRLALGLPLIGENSYGGRAKDVA